MIRIGLISFGKSRGIFFRAIFHSQKKVGDIVLSAICDKNFTYNKAVAKHNIKTFINVQDML